MKREFNSPHPDYIKIIQNKMKLLIKPAILGLVALGIWILLRFQFGILADKADEGIMASGTIAFLFFVYGLMAAFIMAKVWTEWREIETAVRERDEKKFVDLKDQRVPRTLKMLLIIFSIFIAVAFFLSGFQNSIKGVFSVFAIVFMLTVVWEVLMDLDDYFTGEWNIDIHALPEAWQSKYFGEKKK